MVHIRDFHGEGRKSGTNARMNRFTFLVFRMILIFTVRGLFLPGLKRQNPKFSTNGANQKE